MHEGSIVIIGYYAIPTCHTSIVYARLGAEALLIWHHAIVSLSHPNKDERATDSCFTLVGAHRCGILMEG